MRHDLPKTGCGQKHIITRRVPYIPFSDEVNAAFHKDSGINAALIITLCLSSFEFMS